MGRLSSFFRAARLRTNMLRHIKGLYDGFKEVLDGLSSLIVFLFGALHGVAGFEKEFNVGTDFSEFCCWARSLLSN